VEVAEGGIKQEESEFQSELILRLLPKLEWKALRQTASEMGIAELPEVPPPAPEEDEAFLRSLHALVMDVHVVEGALVCPNCARSYPIKKGIPNMLLREDEL
jgi:multifunctional methyltransferase subunit TRM112